MVFLSDGILSLIPIVWNILPEQTFFAYSNSPIDTHNLFAGRVTSRSKKTVGEHVLFEIEVN